MGTRLATLLCVGGRGGYCLATVPAVLRYSKELASVTQVQSRFSIIREGSLKFITPEVSEEGERESSYTSSFLESYILASVEHSYTSVTHSCSTEVEFWQLGEPVQCSLQNKLAGYSASEQHTKVTQTDHPHWYRHLDSPGVREAQELKTN